MKWYNLLAAPIAVCYGAAVHVRNDLYRAHILHSHSVSIPTICVGNLAVGGTGKTPFVEYLIRLLSPSYQVAVLSRGYRRKTRGFVLASSEATALTIGDEPMQIHQKFPDIPVAVCADRVEGVNHLQQLCPHVQVVILDDAFQHRQIKCGFSILLTAHDRLYVDDHYLPMGTLRDAPHESLRAAAVVVTKCPTTMQPIDRRIVGNKLHLPTFQQLYFSYIQYENIPDHQRVLLLTGIASPEYLLQEVKKHNPNTRLMAYPDHYRFTKQDMQKISAEAARYDVVLTTEKDYVRLLTLSLPSELIHKIQVVPISITLNDEENMLRQIRQYINENLQPKK